MGNLNSSHPNVSSDKLSLAVLTVTDAGEEFVAVGTIHVNLLLFYDNTIFLLLSV